MKCRSFKETKLFANIQGSCYTMALLIGTDMCDRETKVVRKGTDPRVTSKLRE